MPPSRTSSRGVSYPALPAVLSVCRQVAGDFAYAWFGCFRRRVLSRAVPGSDVREPPGEWRLNHFFPALNISPAAFAIAGMGGVVGGATGAAMAAIVMIFEMTLDYTVIVPMTLTVAISYAVRRSLIKDSIYTRKLLCAESPSRRRCARMFNSPGGAARIYAPSPSGGNGCVRGRQRRRISKESVTVLSGNVLVGRRSQDACQRRVGRTGDINGWTIRSG